MHGQVLHPLLPGGGVRVEPGAEEDARQFRELHRVRRLLDRLPVRQHLLPRPPGRVRRPLPKRVTEEREPGWFPLLARVASRPGLLSFRYTVGTCLIFGSWHPLETER